MKEELEVSNIDALDESFSNAISAEQVTKGINLASGLISKIDSGRTTGQADIDAQCGKKPFCVEFFGNGCNTRKSKYNQCVSDAQRRKAEAPIKAQEFENEKARLLAELENIKLQKAQKLQQERLQQQQVLEQQRQQQKLIEESKKFLGMPKALGISVVVVGGLGLLVGGFFLVRKLAKK